jgi:hypothetical protein
VERLLASSVPLDTSLSPQHVDRPVSSHRLTRDTFPTEAVRDLLGITRGLYRAERDGAGDPVRLQELVEIGEEYKTALDLARRGGPQSLGASAAWHRATEATARLCTLVSDETRAAPMVLAAAGCVRRGA